MTATHSSLLAAAAAAAAGIDDGDILLEAGGCPIGDAHGVLLSSTGPPVDEAAANVSAVSVPCSARAATRATMRELQREQQCESYSESNYGARATVREQPCESFSARASVREQQCESNSVDIVSRL